MVAYINRRLVRGWVNSYIALFMEIWLLIHAQGISFCDLVTYNLACMVVCRYHALMPVNEFNHCLQKHRYWIMYNYLTNNMYNHCTEQSGVYCLVRVTTMQIFCIIDQCSQSWYKPFFYGELARARAYFVRSVSKLHNITFHKISRNLESVRAVFWIFISFWNLSHKICSGKFTTRSHGNNWLFKTVSCIRLWWYNKCLSRWHHILQMNEPIFLT